MRGAHGPGRERRSMGPCMGMIGWEGPAHRPHRSVWEGWAAELVVVVVVVVRLKGGW